MPRTTLSAFSAIVFMFDVGMGTALAGHGSHGGDDVLPGSDSAWILGSDTTIDVCVVLSKAYRPLEDEIKIIIEKSFRKWIDYVEAWNLNDFDERHAYMQYPRKIDVNTICANPSLTMYFGVENDEVKNAKARLNNPVGFAYKYPDKQDNKTSQVGFIWLMEQSIFYSYAGSVEHSLVNDMVGLEGIILHEWGHILGMPHIPGTIMDENIVRTIVDKKYASETEDNFQQRRMRKLLSLEDSYNFVEKPIYVGRFGGNAFPQAKNLAKFLFGRDDFKWGSNNSSLERISENRTDGRLQIKLHSGNREVEILDITVFNHLTTPPSNFNTSPPISIFNRYSKEFKWKTSSSFLMSSFFGKVKAYNNKFYPVNITYNSNHAPVSIQLVCAQGVLNLFDANPATPLDYEFFYNAVNPVSELCQ